MKKVSRVNLFLESSPILHFSQNPTQFNYTLNKGTKRPLHLHKPKPPPTEEHINVGSFFQVSNPFRKLINAESYQ